MHEDRKQHLSEFVAWVRAHLTAGEKVVPPGIPPDYPEPNKLITDDCIQPRKLGLWPDA
jgi:hypothetical protein